MHLTTANEDPTVKTCRPKTGDQTELNYIGRGIINLGSILRVLNIIDVAYRIMCTIYLTAIFLQSLMHVPSLNHEGDNKYIKNFDDLQRASLNKSVKIYFVTIEVFSVVGRLN